MKPGFVYIMTNKTNTVLYTGVTSRLPFRIRQHKEGYFQGSFTFRYHVHKLVYWEAFQDIGDAIAREKQVKAGSRKKKLALIEAMNPEWRDLFEEVKDVFGFME